MEEWQKIGQTPLKELKEIEKYFHLPIRIWAKLEHLNASGSIKDRPAYFILQDAIKAKKLRPGMKIVEASSGNMGISLSMIGTALGYEVDIVMPESMSLERRALIQKYGGHLVLTSALKGMKGAVEVVEEWKKREDIFVPSQFENPNNVYAHYEGTGPEILTQMNEKIDAFCISFGSGGTITGVGKYCKEKDKNIIIIAAEPSASPLLSKGIAGKHRIEGIGANFLPSILDASLIDDIVLVEESESIQMAKLIAKLEGESVGISSGANVVAVLKAMKKHPNLKHFVTVFPDSSSRYGEILNEK